MSRRSGLWWATALLLGFFGVAETCAAGRTEDHETYLVYVPEGLTPGAKCPLIFALSPGADAAGAMKPWQETADRRHWIVASSKEFKNGVDWEIVLPQIERELTAVEESFPVDRTRVVLTGLSGGAMGAHGFTGFHPDRIRAVVANTGMMLDAFQVNNYPRGKLVVFLASPTDFRYKEMQRDRQFLEGKGWATQWIEFAGGHTLAPAAVCSAAADWLSTRW